MCVIISYLHKQRCQIVVDDDGERHHFCHDFDMFENIRNIIPICVCCVYLVCMQKVYAALIMTALIMTALIMTVWSNSNFLS